MPSQTNHRVLRTGPSKHSPSPDAKNKRPCIRTISIPDTLCNHDEAVVMASRPRNSNDARMSSYALQPRSEGYPHLPVTADTLCYVDFTALQRLITWQPV